MSVLVEQRWNDGIANATCLMLPKTHPLHLATEHFHFATTSPVLRDITANDATDITREKTQKVWDWFSTTNSSVLGDITTNGATETSSKTLQDWLS